MGHHGDLSARVSPDLVFRLRSHKREVCEVSDFRVTDSSREEVVNVLNEAIRRPVRRTIHPD